ncbi:MAG TPA: TonB-dependent receptor plug domain-containing protein, partial [Terriglobia bacterium]|nr:TonB-dependent receptor plug domain-containing protein [Terriglobia bacterium]
MYRHNAGFTSIPFPTPPAACSAGRSRWQMLLASGLSLVALIFPAAIEAQVALPNYAEMGIEALLNIEVISAVKRQEPLFRSPSAIFVITQEDIRRSGASNIPDLLRMVPGLQVAQVDAYGWAISVRGFAERYANKLLVLIDGRTVYDPLFAGVHWDVQNLLLEDVERIEVVRGPGATLWGANAVNGVINILTRSSQETQGGMIAASSGSIEPARVHARYGGTLGSAATYRISGNYFRRDHSVDAAREPIADAWQAGSLGFRADWFATPKDSVLFQTGVQVRGADESLLLPVLTPPFQTLSVSRQQHRTGNALVRWTRRQRPDSEWSLQAYYDLLDFHSQALEEHLHTVDLDFQHQFRLSERHQWFWGLCYRLIMEEFRGSFLIAIEEEAEQQFS